MVFREGRTKAVGTILRLIPKEEELARGITISRGRAQNTADRISSGSSAPAAVKA